MNYNYVSGSKNGFNEASQFLSTPHGCMNKAIIAQPLNIGVQVENVG